MATAEEYANWIVTNKDKQGTPEFDKVKQAYQLSRQQTQNIDSVPQEKKSDFGSLISGDISGSEYLGKRADAVKSVFDPETWKKLGQDLIRPVESPLKNGKLVFNDISPEDSKKYRDEAMNMVTSMLPVSRLAGSSRDAILKPIVEGGPLKQAALDVAGKAGYSLPRSNINQSFLTNLGERFGGKQAIEATAQMKNQPVTNKLAAKALGLSDDAVITPDVLKGIREQAGKAYESVKNIGTLSTDKEYFQGLKSLKENFSGASKDFPELASKEVEKLTNALKKKTISSEGAVEMVKHLRDAAKTNLRNVASQQDKTLGRAQRHAADLLDDLIERNMGKTGSGNLDAYKKARELIAKTYTVENALVGENVSAQKIAKAASKVKLSDELKQIADFSTVFPRLTRVEAGAPASGGLLEPMIYGAAGSLATGPFGATASLIPVLGKPIARRLMTTTPKIQSRSALADALDKFLVQRAAIGAASTVDK